jgi:hypothetical protein
MRLLMDEILLGHLDCMTLILEKWREGSSSDPEFHIRHHLEAVEECIYGKRYDRKLMKWALIPRYAFESWCERRSIPLPEFWFPPGWTNYQWPTDEDDDNNATPSNQALEDNDVQDKRRRVRIACQVVATNLWEANPELSIKEVANSDEVQLYGGGSQFQIETIQSWLGEVDPRDPSKKRGRKRKKQLVPPHTRNHTTNCFY